MNKQDLEQQELKRIHEEHSERAVGLAFLAFLGSSLITALLVIIL